MVSFSKLPRAAQISLLLTSLLLLAVIGSGIAWLHSDTTVLRQQLQQQVHDRLGTTLDFGVIVPGLSPAGPTLQLTDLKLTTAAGMLTAAQADLTLGWRSLLSHKPAVRRAKLQALGWDRSGTIMQQLVVSSTDDKLVIAGDRFTIEGRYSRAGDLQRLDGINIMFGEQVLTGGATLQLAQPRSRLTLALTAKQLVLDGRSEAVAASSGSVPLFSRAPLPWWLLQAIDLDATLNAEQVAWRATPLGPLHLGVTIADEQLQGALVMQPLGSTQPLTARLRATMRQEAAVQIDAPQLDPLLWAGWLHASSVLQSPASFSLTAAGHGVSLHDLAASANGQAQFAVQPGVINLTAVPPWPRRILEAFVGPEALAKASLGCLQGVMKVENGVLRISGGDAGLGLDSNLLAIAGEGQINLNDETAAVRLVGAPKLPHLQGMLVPLDIAGSLSYPSLTLDLRAIAGHAAGHMVQQLATILPTTRVGIVIAQATGNDPRQLLIAMPANPCINTAAKPVSAQMQPNATPQSWQETLRNTRDLLDQVIKAAEPVDNQNTVSP